MMRGGDDEIRVVYGRQSPREKGYRKARPVSREGSCGMQNNRSLRSDF